MTLNDIKKLVDEEVGARPEAVVDFLAAVAAACENTAAHVEENWQDRKMARAWMRIAEKVDKVGAFAHENLPFQPR